MSKLVSGCTKTLTQRQPCGLVTPKISLINLMIGNKSSSQKFNCPIMSIYPQKKTHSCLSSVSKERLIPVQVSPVITQSCMHQSATTVHVKLSQTYAMLASMRFVLAKPKLSNQKRSLTSSKWTLVKVANRLNRKT